MPSFPVIVRVIRVLNGNLHPELSQEILNPAPLQAPLVLADSEHYTTELLDHVHLETPFELLVPMPPQKLAQLQNQALSASIAGGLAMPPYKDLIRNGETYCCDSEP